MQPEQEFDSAPPLTGPLGDIARAVAAAVLATGRDSSTLTLLPSIDDLTPTIATAQASLLPGSPDPRGCVWFTKRSLRAFDDTPLAGVEVRNRRGRAEGAAWKGRLVIGESGKSRRLGHWQPLDDIVAWLLDGHLVRSNPPVPALLETLAWASRCEECSHVAIVWQTQSTALHTCPTCPVATRLSTGPAHSLWAPRTAPRPEASDSVRAAVADVVEADPWADPSTGEIAELAPVLADAGLQFGCACCGATQSPYRITSENDAINRTLLADQRDPLGWIGEGLWRVRTPAAPGVGPGNGPSVSPTPLARVGWHWCATGPAHVAVTDAPLEPEPRPLTP